MNNDKAIIYHLTTMHLNGAKYYPFGKSIPRRKGISAGIDGCPDPVVGHFINTVDDLHSWKKNFIYYVPAIEEMINYIREFNKRGYYFFVKINLYKSYINFEETNIPYKMPEEIIITDDNFKLALTKACEICYNTEYEDYCFTHHTYKRCDECDECIECYNSNCINHGGNE